MGWLILNYNVFEIISIIATAESFLQCQLGKDPSLGGCFILKLCHLYIQRGCPLTSYSAIFHLHSKNSTSNIWGSSLLIDIWDYCTFVDILLRLTWSVQSRAFQSYPNKILFAFKRIITYAQHLTKSYGSILMFSQFFD